MAEPPPEEPQEQTSLYTIVGCSPTATQEEIRQAYRARARQIHPDRNQNDPNANEKFQQLQEAYEVLKNPESRERYDRFGKGGEPETPEDVNEFELITQILGLGRSRAPPTGKKVSPTVRMLTVPAHIVYTGGSVTKTTKIHVVCPACKGVGSKNGVDYPICPECGGAGSLLPGGLQFLAPCHNCRKIGYIMPQEARCKECGGRRVIRQNISIEVPIEMGLQDEMPITIPNKGDQYPGKEPADLVFMPAIRMPSNMARDGDDLFIMRNLSDEELKHGTAFSFRHPSGEEYCVYTEEGKPIDVNRIKWFQNCGMPSKGNDQFKGNLYILFRATHPGWIREKFMMTGVYFARKKANKLLVDAPDEINESVAQRIANFEIEEEDMNDPSRQSSA